MQDPRIENLSFADLFAVYKYVDEKIETIKANHTPDPDDPTKLYGDYVSNESHEPAIDVTMVPEASEWIDILGQVEDEMEDRIKEMFEL